MNYSSLLRLLSVLFGGLLILGVVLGSVGLSQLDPALVVQRPTRRLQIPTPTLYPTLAPVTPRPSPTPGTPSPDTPATPTEEACPPPAGWQPYEVRAGDSIYTLAWTAQITANRLAQANCLTTMDLQPGDIIYLPPIAFGPPPTEEIEPCGPPSHWRIAYVQPGDTLYSLSVRYGTTVDAIRRANCMSAGETLYAGQALYLPPEIAVWPTHTPTQTPTPSLTPSLTPSPTPSATPTAAPRTLTPTPTATATPSITVTATPTSITPTPTPTATPEAPTQTPSPTPTGTISITPTPTLGTATPSLTPTPTPTAPTSTSTPTPSPTATLSPATPTPTATTPPLTPTPMPSPSPTP